MVCPVYHFKIAALVALLVARHGELDRKELKRLLYAEVNSQYDKSADARLAITAAEANAFIRKLYDGSLAGDAMKETVAKELESIFYPAGLKPFKENNGAKIGVESCHDGDTCRISEPAPANCKVSPPSTPIRVSGIDAPEVAGSKLEENVGKLVKELGPSMSADTIREHIVYDGKLTGLVLNDMIAWLIANGGTITLRESQNRFSTNKGLCGVWEPYDTYMRRLGRLYVEPPELLTKYMMVRLPILLKGKGADLYRETVYDSDGNKREGMAGLTNPTILAGEVLTLSSKWITFIETGGRAVDGDLAAALVHLGLAYPYLKYRHQDGALYEQLGATARANGTGHWAEKTFVTLYQINLTVKDPTTGVPIYNPPDCLGK